MGQWVGLCQINNKLINLDLIKIICRDTPPMGRCMDSWVDGWFSGLMGGVRSYC